MAKSKDLTVFITTGDATCYECGKEMGRRAWIMLTEERIGMHSGLGVYARVKRTPPAASESM
jgi:hypothetical protein